MVSKWAGKVAVVTGTSAGIGAAILKDFANNGINVIGLARRSEKVDEIIKSLGPTKGKAYSYKCDISNPEDVETAFKWLEKEFGVVNILVNNAGIGRFQAKIFDKDNESLRMMNEVVDTNLRGLTHCSREAYRLMKKSDDYGLIVNINSVAGHYVPFMESSPLNIYPASKFAVRALSESMRQELMSADNRKIRVTVSSYFHKRNCNLIAP